MVMDENEAQLIRKLKMDAVAEWARETLAKSKDIPHKGQKIDVEPPKN